MNIALRFEDIEYKEPLYRIYPDKVGGTEVHKMPSILISEEGFIALT
jgi:hypothetical protein